MDFRKMKNDHHLPLDKNGETIERMFNFRFLTTHILEDLTWTHNSSCQVRKAQQRLHVLRALRKMNVSPHLLLSFYHCSVECPDQRHCVVQRQLCSWLHKHKPSCPGRDLHLPLSPQSNKHLAGLITPSISLVWTTALRQPNSKSKNYQTDEQLLSRSYHHIEQKATITQSVNDSIAVNNDAITATACNINFTACLYWVCGSVGVF